MPGILASHSLLEHQPQHDRTLLEVTRRRRQERALVLFTAEAPRPAPPGANTFLRLFTSRLVDVSTSLTLTTFQPYNTRSLHPEQGALALLVCMLLTHGCPSWFRVLSSPPGCGAVNHQVVSASSLLQISPDTVCSLISAPKSLSLLSRAVLYCAIIPLPHGSKSMRTNNHDSEQ